VKTFQFGTPKSLAQVTASLAGANADVRVMGGGTDLLAEIKEGLIEPDVVVNLKAVPGLAYIRRDADGLAVGACASVADLAEEASVAKDYRLLHQAASVIASPQLRNMGTVGGNLCQRPRCWYYRDAATVCSKKGGSQCFAEKGRNKYHAVFGGGLCWSVYPSDLAPALIALEAKVVLVSPQGERTVPLAEFYAPPIVNVRRENVLARGELVKEVRVPAPKPGDRGAYIKFMERGAWDFAVVSAAARLTLSGGSIAEARIVCGGVAPVPWRLKAAEDALRGRTVTESSAAQAAARAAADARPLAENGYKVDIFKAVVARAVLAAAKP
jgi:xanthine dehydrogenase YagS FAD-binding subunit